jgi:hypothetical protein
MFFFTIALGVAGTVWSVTMTHGIWVLLFKGSVPLGANQGVLHG